MARAFGRDHRDVDARRRGDQPETDVEPVREEHRIAVGEVRSDLALVHGRLLRVGQQDHDEVRVGRGLGHGDDTEAGRLRLGARGRPGPQPDPHVDAGIVEVQRVRMALRAVADDGHLARPDQGGVRVLLVVEIGHAAPVLVSRGECCLRCCQCCCCRAGRPRGGALGDVGGGR